MASGMPCMTRPLSSGLGAMALNRKRSRFNVFTVDAAILLVGNARAIIHDAVEHQGGRAPAGITPERLRDVLEVGRAQIELPQFVGVSRLESHRRWPTCQSHVVIAPLAQVAIDRG